MRTNESVLTRSHLVHALVQIDRDHTSGTHSERWEDLYASRLADEFGARATVTLFEPPP